MGVEVLLKKKKKKRLSQALRVVYENLISSSLPTFTVVSPLWPLALYLVTQDLCISFVSACNVFHTDIYMVCLYTLDLCSDVPLSKFLPSLAPQLLYFSSWHLISPGILFSPSPGFVSLFAFVS